MEYSDRYAGNCPDPNTMCQGECEGLGFYPEYQGDIDEDGIISLDTFMEEGRWKIVTCPDCGGTGRNNSGPD